ncbi:hypothetical protein ACLIA0_01625 [Bacillaceae bacterium W0354]
MDEHKKVRVTMNQHNQSNQHKKHDLEYVLTPKNNKSNLFKSSKQKMFSKLLKPILFAVLLGAIFGVGFVYFFSDLTPQSVPVFSSDDDREKNEDKPNEDKPNESETEDQKTTVFERSALTKDIIQFGIFSTNENAFEHAKTLKNQHIPTVIHEHQGQYYVLSMMVNSESERETVTKWLENQGLEYMVDFMFKPWNFKSVQADVNENELQWLEKGENLISSSNESQSEWMSQVKTWADEAPERYKNNYYVGNIQSTINQFNHQSEQINQSMYANTVRLNIQLLFGKIIEN